MARLFTRCCRTTSGSIKARLTMAGGSGYLRLLEFDYRKKEIRVRTYSPYLNRYITDDTNQFTLSLDL